MLLEKPIFSLILPEGGMIALRMRSVIRAIQDTQRANWLREEKGSVPLLFLNRTSGRVFTAGGLGRWRVGSLPEALLTRVTAPPEPERLGGEDQISSVWRAVTHDTRKQFGHTLVLRRQEETLVVYAPPGQDMRAWVGSATRTWQYFTCTETDTLARAWTMNAERERNQNAIRTLRDMHATVHFHNRLAAAEWYGVTRLGRAETEEVPVWVHDAAREALKEEKAC